MQNNDDDNNKQNEEFKLPSDVDEKGEKRWKRNKPANRTNAGTRPHRCDVRYTDFLKGTTVTLSPSVSWSLWRVFWKCMRSEFGEEPRDPLRFIDDDTYEFYQEMQAKRQLREKFIDNRNPFEPLDHEVYLPPRQQDLEKQERSSE